MVSKQAISRPFVNQFRGSSCNHDTKRPSFRSFDPHTTRSDSDVSHHHRLEDVELEVPVRAPDRYGHVVSHHLSRRSLSSAPSQESERRRACTKLHRPHRNEPNIIVPLFHTFTRTINNLSYPTAFFS